MAKSSSYSDVQRQIAALQVEAERLRSKEVAGVIERMKEAIAVYGITAQDLGFGAGARGRRGKASAKSGAAPMRGRKRGGGKVSDGVKYRNDEGLTWGGRGPRPRWLREALAGGKSLEDFAV